jgi:mRNA interferase MazF
LIVKRGDLVTVATAGDYGKPRPALVVQSDWLTATDSVLVCLMTSTLRDTPFYRLTIDPTEQNGLHQSSQVMVDKIVAVRRDKCGPIIGHLDEVAMMTLNRMLALVIGIAD